MKNKLDKFKIFILSVQSGKEKHVLIYRKIINVIEKITVIFLCIGLIAMAALLPDLKVGTRIITLIFSFFMLYYEFPVNKIIKRIKRKRDSTNVSNCSGKNSSDNSKK